MTKDLTDDELIAMIEKTYGLTRHHSSLIAELIRRYREAQSAVYSRGYQDGYDRRARDAVLWPEPSEPAPPEKPVTVTPR
jgi:hypothetical protein